MKKLYIPHYSPDGLETEWETVSGGSLGEIYKKMCCMLSGDQRGISAYASKNSAYEPRIICSLYEGSSVIRGRNGRIIYKS